MLQNLKRQMESAVRQTPLQGVLPGPPQFLLILPALALIVGLTGISWWVKKTARALDEKKRKAALEAKKGQ